MWGVVHNGCTRGGGRVQRGVVPTGASCPTGRVLPNGGGPDIRAPPSTSMSRQRATGWRPWHNMEELVSEYMHDTCLREYIL